MKIPSQIIENYIYANFNPVKKSGTELHFNTPFSQDGKLRLYVHPDTSTWYDQKNQRGGSFSKFVSEYEDINEKEVYFFLIKEYSNGLKEFLVEEEKERIKQKLEIPSGLTLFAEAKKSIIAEQAVRYLLSRKISKENILQMGYFFDPNNTEWSKRIFIPFYENNELVYFIGRAFDNNKLRYNTPKNQDSKEFVFNIDKIENEVAICEGVFDALSIDNITATAMLSADIGVKQVQKIIDKGVEKIVVIPDTDETGNATLQKNIDKIIYYTPPSLNVSIMIFNIPKPFKDFNEYKIKTGCGNIEDKDCVLYNKRTMLLKNFVLKTGD